LIYIGIAGFYLKSFSKYNSINYHPLKWLVLILTLTSLSWVLKDAAIIIKFIISLVLGASGLYFTLLFKNKLSLNNL
jgi:hypothetical protein